MGKKQLSTSLLFLVGGLIAGFLIGRVLPSRSTSSDPVVAEYRGKPVRASDAFRGIQDRLYDQQESIYSIKRRAIADYIEQKLIDEEAAKLGISIEELLKRQGDVSPKDITEAEVETFLASKKINPKDPRVRREDIRNYLAGERNSDKRKIFVTKMAETANVRILLDAPDFPKATVTTDGMPSWGNSSAPVTLVAFLDFQCPFSARAILNLDQLKQIYGPEKLRIVFGQLPLHTHPQALPGALASMCANEQNKFWEYSDYLFKNQWRMEDADLKSYAKSLGMNESDFAACYDKKKYLSFIQNNQEQAQKAGIQSTPAFIINGQVVHGLQPMDVMKQKIDRHLKS